MLTKLQIEEIVSNLRYKDWTFYVGGTDAQPYLQLQFYAVDCDTPLIPYDNFKVLQKCRKWQLSPYMVPTEIVRTAWKAVLAAEEHEAAESFTYKGQTIYNPHVDLDALAEFMKEGHIVSRIEMAK